MNIEERANIYVGHPTSMGEDFNIVTKRSSYIKGGLDQLNSDIDIVSEFLCKKINNKDLNDLIDMLKKQKHS